MFEEDGKVSLSVGNELLYNKKERLKMSTLKSKLLDYAKNELNVLFVGTHGIGKTMSVMEVARELDLKFKYYSTSTLDPWADLVGVPVPDNETKTLDFYRPKDLEDAEFVLFDELNRAHPRVLNAVLEIIQFKSINGKRLPNLKMVWAAINPPGGQYQVEDLDPVLVDRFHVYVEMKANVDPKYLKTVMKEQTAEVLTHWWTNDLDDKQRTLVTPRRVEYLGRLIDSGVAWRDAMPLGHTFPVQDLSKRLDAASLGQYDDLKVSKDDILTSTAKYVKRIKEDPSFALKIKNFLVKFKEEELFEVRDLLELMPPDIVENVANKKFLKVKVKFKKKFEDSGIDANKYPRISRAFKFDKSDETFKV